MHPSCNKNRGTVQTRRSLQGLLIFSILLSSCRLAEHQEHERSQEPVVWTDTAFWQEYHEAYPVNAGPGSEEVRSIATDSQDNIWIATAAGVFTKKNGETDWLHVLPAEDQGPSYAVMADDRSAVWMSTWNSVYRYIDGRIEPMPGAVSPVSSLCEAAEGIYAAGPHGAWLYTEGGCDKKDYPVARSIRDVASDNNGGLWVASDVGLYHSTKEGTLRLAGDDGLISTYVRGLAVDGERLWAAGLGGITILKQEKKEKELRPEHGIPSVYMNCIARSPEGVMWAGTDVGVVRYRPDGSHSLLFSRRWLLDNKVNDIAFDSEGNAWVATAGGVSAIKRKKMTLASKQRYFYDVLMRRHIREPWIAGQCRLPVAGDTLRWEPEDDDNDGEYTGCYLAMESFRYAVTKDNDAREKAGKAFRFLKLLRDVTESDGFFARTVVPSHWTEVHDVNRTYTDRQLADALVREPRFKPVEERWHKSKDGKWMWKGDTSSDEMCGHMFGYFFYYELAADEAEKAAVRSHVAGIVDHLIAHNFTLTDIDGKHTRWGVWSPDKLNRDPEWMPDRSLNSMEMLAFLKLAQYMTGEEKYEREYRRLIDEEGYLDNMSRIAVQDPAWFIYFDVVLAAYMYPILLTCEKDPELLRFYEAHMDKWIDRHREDKSPLLNFIYCYARDKKVEINSSVEFLTETPLDLIDWPVDHSLREDVKVVRRPELGDRQIDELPPPAIRATVRWDKNPWAIQTGNVHREREPVFWLLPYWMGRYLEMIR